MPDSTVDWFVTAGARFGDGSRNKPFHDPWLAIRSAGPGDVIHVATGTYFGRYDRSSWIIACPQLTIRGGYDREFSQRTPWKTPSVLAAFYGYESTRENNLITGRQNHSELVLDGLFFDAAGRNTYGDGPEEGITSYPQMDGPIASFSCEKVTIKNCVFANSAAGGVELSGDGSRFENNLVINIIGPDMLKLRNMPGGNGQSITVVNNSFCFAHDNIGPVLGTGADCAIGLRIERRAEVRENIFVGCGNAAVAFFLDAERISLEDNLFFLSPHDIVKTWVQGVVVDIREKNFYELEDVGFKSAAGNVIQDPGIHGFKVEWIDAYSRHLLANYATPPRDAVNAFRTTATLLPLSAADLESPKSKGYLAPRLRPVDALALSFDTKQGYHSVELATELATHLLEKSPTYHPVDWNAIDQPDPSIANQLVELRAGLGLEQNTTLLADANPSSHMGILIYRPDPSERSIYVLAKRNTLVSRQYEESVKYESARDVESTYLLRGRYRADILPTSRQKVTIIIDSIVFAPPVFDELPARPEGRNWFVKAGANGGDGTKEKPFRDPFQALDKAAGGDAIHVTGGDYFGRLHSGKWKITTRNLMLLGGYDAQFAERDPWMNPTRFLLDKEEKTKGSGNATPVLESEENNGGLILDGFVFDGATYNNYAPDGSLDLNNSPLVPLVALRGNGLPIVVRNCTFLNASSGAIRINCPLGTFENNLVLNSSNWSLLLDAGGPGPWLIHNNSFLFACDPSERAGTGKSSSDGSLVILTGRAVTELDSNIFAFADNYGVRAAVAQQNVSFNNNIFAANLFSHLTDEQYLWADDSSWERRAVSDSSYSSFESNAIDLPKLAIDSIFADKALIRLFSLPSRISPAQWKVFASKIGSNAKPASPIVSSAVPTPDGTATATAPQSPPGVTSTPSKSSSLSELLSRLNSLKTKTAQLETPETAVAAGQIYCSAYDWKRALDLVAVIQEVSEGAHKLVLQPLFLSEHLAKQEVLYRPVSPQEIDTEHTSLDNKSVELKIKALRDVSTDPGYFPTGITGSDFSAISVTHAEGATHTHIAILVPHDAAASKTLSRVDLKDTLRICGTARLPRDQQALSIVVDTLEILEA